MNDATTRDPFPGPDYVQAAVNGHDALRFTPIIKADEPDDPTSLSVPDAGSLRFGSNDFAYLAIMRWRNSNVPSKGEVGSGVILAKQSTAEGYAGVLLMANYPAVFANFPANTGFAAQLEVSRSFVLSSTDGFNDDAFRLYAVRRVGTNFSVRVNGVPDNAIRISKDRDVSAVGFPLVIGGNSGMPLDGDIAELIALRGSTSDADFAALEAGLMDKYGLR